MGGWGFRSRFQSEFSRQCDLVVPLKAAVTPIFLTVIQSRLAVHSIVPSTAGSPYAVCDKSRLPSFSLFYVRCSFLPPLYVILPHFSCDLNSYSPAPHLNTSNIFSVLFSRSVQKCPAPPKATLQMQQFISFFFKLTLNLLVKRLAIFLLNAAFSCPWQSSV